VLFCANEPNSTKKETDMKKKLLLPFFLLSLWTLHAQDNPHIEGDVLLCPWTDGTAYVTNPVFDTYQWYFKYWFLTDDFVAIEGATESTFTYDWYTYDQSLFKVIATLGGVDYESNIIQIDSWAWLPIYFMYELTPGVTYDPETETFALCEGATFTVQINNPPYDTLIQWYNNEVPVEGATSSTYGITEAGSYTATAAPSFCPYNSSTTGIPIVVAMVDCSVGFPEIDTKTLKIYPNPAAETFTIELPENTAFEHFEIADITGRVLIQNKLKPGFTRIGASDLPSGIYLLKLSGNGNFITKQLIRL
jgi:hypothetical protein